MKTEEIEYRIKMQAIDPFSGLNQEYSVRSKDGLAWAIETLQDYMHLDKQEIVSITCHQEMAGWREILFQ